MGSWRGLKFSSPPLLATRELRSLKFDKVFGFFFQGRERKKEKNKTSNHTYKTSIHQLSLDSGLRAVREQELKEVACGSGPRQISPD